MSHFKPYPKYKPSGVEWLGDVPEHWEVTRLKRGFTVKLGKMLQPNPKSNTDRLLPYMRASNIQPSGIDVSDVREMWFSPIETETLRLSSGDLLVSEGGDVGRSAIWSDELPEAYFQNSINRIRPIGNNSNVFLGYLLNSIKSTGVIDVICNRLSIAHLTAEKLNEIDVVFPDASEQSAIAAFLDRETGRIDALVEKKRRFIALLKEKRQALIAAAVTGKFDVRTCLHRGSGRQAGKPYPAYKLSGVEWLGDVPEHWEVKAFKWLATIRNGANFKDVAADDGEYPVYGSGGLFGRASSYLYDGASVLLGRKGTIDKPLFVMGRFWVVDTMFFTEILPCAMPRFVYYVATTIPFDRYSTNTALPSMTQEDLSTHIIVAPNFSEQSAIAAFLDRETKRIDALVDKTEKSIELLREKRAALITAAVTGKIDVRGNETHRV